MANRTKDQIEIETFDLPAEAGALSRTERFRSEERCLAVREAFLDPAWVPADTPITGIGVVKDSTTRRWMKGPTTAAGESAISIRVQAILGIAHRMQNPVSNAQLRQG